jgi:plastocyanin
VRRILVVAVALLALPVASARAAETTVAVGDDFFNPSTVQIAAGDTVKWVFEQNSVGNHNISTKANQPESFDSDPGRPPPLISHPPGYTYSYTFNKDNVEVDYTCRVHPTTMNGTVRVGSPPADTAAPAVTGVKAKVAKKAVRIGFKLDEDATVVLKVAKAKKPKRALRTVRKSLAAGTRSIKVRRKGLAEGRYRVTITAEDDAGNTSTVARKSFRIS